MNFERYMRYLFYRTPPGDYFYTKIYFTTKIVKSPLEKETKTETACKKNNETCSKKTYLNQVFISYYYSKIYVLLFSLLPLIYESTRF